MRIVKRVAISPVMEKDLSYYIKPKQGKKQCWNYKRLEYIPLEFTYLRKMMNLEKVESYIKEIEKALTELQTHSIKQL